MNDTAELAQLKGVAVDLTARTGCLVTVAEALAAHTSLRIGGPADLFVTVPGDAELSRLLPALAELRRPWTVIGNGTNLLVADAGYRGVVIQLGDGFRGLVRTVRGLAAGAALPLPALARAAVDAELTGCEFLSGIPGTVGGGARMNAGAWGASLADIVVSVSVREPDGTEVAYSGETMGFGYRTSRLMSSSEVVTRVEVSLRPDEGAAIRRRTAELFSARKRTQPPGPSAGSVFKNPAGEKAGRLLEAVGAKGLRRGGAEVSEVHANFIVNTGGATAADVLWLIRELQGRVLEQFGVQLEPEVRFLGLEG